jgi:hypothetical protein
MVLEVQELVQRLEATGRQVLATPTRIETHRDLLQQIQQISTFARAADLPLFLRSGAKDVETAAIRVARTVEAPDAADLEESVQEMQASLDALRTALERGRA